MVQIKVRTGGLLRRYLPEGSKFSEAELDVAAGTTAIKLMAGLGLPSEDQYLVTLNGAVLPIAERESKELADGDNLGIFPPLKGG